MPLNSVLLTIIFFSSPTLILSPATLGAIDQEVSFRVDSIILFGITNKLPSCLQGDEVLM